MDTGILEVHGNAFSAYSLRLLNRYRRDPLIRVRRSVDNLEVDVFPDQNGEISLNSYIFVTINNSLATTLGEFVAAPNYSNPDSIATTNAYISRIYDQSSNTNDVEIYSTSNQYLLFYNTQQDIYRSPNGDPAFLTVALPQVTDSLFKLPQAGENVLIMFGVAAGSGYNTAGFQTKESGLEVGLINYLINYTLFAINDDTEDIIDFEFASFNGKYVKLETQSTFGSTGLDIYYRFEKIEPYNYLKAKFTVKSTKVQEITPAVGTLFTDFIAYSEYTPEVEFDVENYFLNNVVSEEIKAASVTNTLDSDGFLYQYPNAAAAYSVRSLTGYSGAPSEANPSPKILRVRRSIDNVEVDVYTDNSGWVSLDSPIENVYETTINTVNREYISLAATLGEFVADPSYNNPDNITTTTATVSAWYDQSKVNTNLLPLQITDDEAAAAYSVRLINPNYNGPLLKVRRSSDNVTKDIYPNANGELDVDDIEQFIQEGVMGPDYTEEYLLDIIPDGETEAPQAAAAYSLRKLKESYTGPLVRVRRTDGIEVDVYPQQDGWFGLESPIENLVESPVEEGDFEGVLTFKYYAQNDNVTVVTWYDQSGNALDATQPSTTLQPKIYDSTGGVVLDEDNNLPAALFAGDYLNSGTVTAAGTATNFAVGNISGGTTTRALFFTPECFVFFSTADWRVFSSSTQIVYAGNELGLNLHYFGADSAGNFAAINGGALTTSSNVADSGSKIAIGTQSTNVAPFYGYVQECVYYNSDQSSNRPTIEKNINNAFSIYGGWEATVETWYDQSGNGNDASQSDTNAQPTIASGGVVIRENGKPAIQTDGSDDTMSLTSTINFTDLTWFTVTKKADTDSNGGIIFFGGGSNAYAGDDVDNQGNPRLQAPGAAIIRRNTLGNTSASGGEINQHLSYYNRNGTNASGGLNGEVNTEATVATTTFGLTELFQYGSNYNFEGLVQELVLYDSNKKSDRPLIEKSINSYYNIYAQDAAIQNVATAQPTIYNSGLITENGKPAVQFDGTNDHLLKPITLTDTGDSFVATFVTVAQANNPTSDNDSAYPIALYPNVTFIDRRFYELSLENTQTAVRYQGGNTIFNTGDGQAQCVFMAAHINTNSPSVGRLNGSDLTVSSSANIALNMQSDSAIVLGAAGTPTSYTSIPRGMDGKLQEALYYNSDQYTTNRIDIENNINSAFQIYAANFSSVLDSVPLAKAAYSIRRLTKNYIDPIITVTNGSTTKDFYADFWGNLDVDALTSFANGGTLSVTKWWDQSGEGVHLLTTSTRPTLSIANNEVSVNTTNKFYEPLLDRYEGAAAAYSLRILKGDYTGPLVRVRRDGTNTEVDVYPDENLTISLNSPVLNVVTETTTGVTANPADTLATTLGEFVYDAGFSDPDSLGATASAFVVVWYDQANSNNASQDISTSQPKIYDSTTGYLGYLSWYASNQCRLDTSYTIPSEFSVYNVSGSFDLSNSVIALTQRSVGTGRLLAYLARTSGSFLNALQVGGDFMVAAGTPDTNEHLHVFRRNGTTISTRHDGSFGNSITALNAPDNTNLEIGADTTASSLGSPQFHKELIIYENGATNDAGIETNINNHYQIPNFNATASTAQTVAVYNNAINTTVDLNATYTDLKEIIKYE